MLGNGFEDSPLQIDWNARFKFESPPYSPVFPMPFKSPFRIPRGASILGDLSISGLKLEIEKSSAGLETIYFEAFPKFISIGTLFNQSTILKAGVVEQFLRNAATIAALLVKEEQKHARKKSKSDVR